MKKIVLFTILIVYATIMPGQIIRVPADQPTIQAGINAANNGDTVLVANGTYLENINFMGKAIMVASNFIMDNDINHINNTIIDGSQPANPDSASVVMFISGEDTTSVISGFTITGGTGMDFVSGGGIYCEYSSPYLEFLFLKNNKAAWYGGGIACFWSDPTLVNVIIKDNLVDGNGPVLIGARGGGAYFSNSNPFMANVSIYGNWALTYGGGLYCEESNPVFDPINRCNIYQNYAAEGKDLCSWSSIEVVLDTFSVAFPTDFYATPLYNFSMEILHGVIEQVDADLYISPEGDNSNSGINANEPFKNIFHAFSVIRADSIHQHTIHLLEGIYSPSSTGENFPVMVIDYVNLSGTSEAGVFLNADSTAGVLSIGYNVSNTISNMTITGGDGNFGGIECNFSNPLLEDLTITGNRSYIQLQGWYAGAGGGMICNSSSPHLVNVTIHNNTAGREGGGIYCINADPNLENVTINDNSADYGGGIYCDNSTPILHNVTISGNKAIALNGKGGGILCYSAGLIIKNTIITGNTAIEGGGIYCGSSDIEIDNVTINHNSAIDHQGNGGRGGGMFMVGGSNPIMQNLTISYNSATGDEGYGGYGGGIYCESSDPAMQNVTISNNSAESYGGGIYSQNSSNLLFSETNRCNIYLNTAKGSNDLYSDRFVEVIVDTFTVKNPSDYHAFPFNNFSFDILHGKLVQYNADIYVSPAGNNNNSGINADEPFQTLFYSFTRILADSLNQNTIHLLKGAYSPSTNTETFPVKIPDYINLSGSSEDDVILDAEGELSVIEFLNNNHSFLSGLTITGANNHLGEAIYCNNSSPTLQDIRINDNLASGIGCYDHSNPSLIRVTISKNSSFEGGAISCQGYSNPSLIDVTLSENIADYGGGMFCASNSDPTLQNVLITGNKANDGGGVYIHLDSNPVLTNAMLIDNIAYHDGGAVNCYYSSPVILNSLIAKNQAKFGGAMYCSILSKPDLTNVTISDNLADYGGGIYCQDACLVTLVNATLWNDIPHEIYFSENGYPDSITVTWSNIQGGMEGIITNDNGNISWIEGNIDEDPLFVNNGDFPYALSYGSPCIDNGIQDTSGLFLPLVDLAENPRIWNGRIDMGAFEWNNMGFNKSPVQSSEFNVQSYPNPFSDHTTIKFHLLEARHISLKVYDHTGREIRLLASGVLVSGEHTFTLQAGELPSGIYFYRLSAGDEVVSEKLVVRKE